jgi:hypothetical protein
VSKLTGSCSEFRSLRRNTLLGFAVVHVDELKLTIRDVAIHQRNDCRWAQLPAKPMLKDGVGVKDADGKIQYSAILEFDSRAVRDAFSSAVIAAVLDASPHAFDEDEAVSS